MKISIKELSEMTMKVIKSYGHSDEHAKSIHDVYMYAQLRGNNQGIVKLFGKDIVKREGAKDPQVVKETVSSGLIDGNKTHAVIVMDQVTDLAIQKATETGLGMVGNFNAEESTGAIGYYVNKIAEAGYVGLAFSASPYATTAPHGSTQALFCTNPMAFAAPTEDDPVVLDMSTSAMAFYGLVEANTANKEVPEGIGYDKDGNPTTNPAEILGGTLKTFGGHKGSGLAMMVQILAGPLVRASFFDKGNDNSGNLVIAIDPDIFGVLDTLPKEVSRMKKEINEAKKLDGVEDIFVPGQRVNTISNANTDAGEIEVEDNLLQQLKDAVKEIEG